MALDLNTKDNADLVSDIQSKISCMQLNYPQHVFQVTNDATITLLLETGRVVDESIVTAPIPSGSSSNRDRDTIPKMELKTRPIGRPAISSLSKKNSCD